MLLGTLSPRQSFYSASQFCPFQDGLAHYRIPPLWLPPHTLNPVLWQSTSDSSFILKINLNQHITPPTGICFVSNCKLRGTTSMDFRY